MSLILRYGRHGLAVTLPDSPHVTVLRMKPAAGLPDPDAAVQAALENPIGSPSLRALAESTRKARGAVNACITISDITRPVPNRLILPPILRVLNECSIPDERITILIGTGLHRPNTDAEIREMLGVRIQRRIRVVNHDARDESTLVHLGGTSRGTPIWIDRLWVEADLRIATSLIEPHLMAGFSGGRKAICPGLAGVRTMRLMHGPQLLSHERACEGVLDGNPFHEEATEIARRARVDFIVNVALSELREITGVFAGDLEAAHAAGCQFVAERATAHIEEPADIVVTSSAGYPLDLTFYQSVKAMTAAMPVVKPGGTMIVAAACEEGIGSSDFARLMRETTCAEQFRRRLSDPEFFVIDQWQLQEMCKALDRADVLYYTDGLDGETVRSLLVTPVSSVEEGLRQALLRHGADARIAVIPEGPYVLPRVRTTGAPRLGRDIR